MDRKAAVRRLPFLIPFLRARPDEATRAPSEGTAAPWRPADIVMVLRHFRGRAGAMRTVLAFTFRHWARQPLVLATIIGAVMISTVADVVLPVFAARLVDAMTLGVTDRIAGRDARLWAFAVIVALGFVMLAMRHCLFLAVTRFTLRTMSDLTAEAFQRVQRFSTDWHANAFAGSTVRKITRGIWAVDLLNDTLLVALLPSLTVLVASSLILGSYWPVMGLVVGGGSVLYMALTIALNRRLGRADREPRQPMGHPARRRPRRRGELQRGRQGVRRRGPRGRASR